ncbi:hypothetical protein AAL_04404 [Moelleriella libera RCEF 2490]|uniref:Uncharacterized protein n=1 Tax=Moelleriella libera RCEF 2490 TaxID=1081109 RepID=A0A168C3S6_9HYPO|nr:hypothetical protein AAL_04404 [Moelleriella libera RCEF 2490]
MPRPGDGSSHNGPFEKAGHDAAVGTAPAETDKVARAGKTADVPEGLREKGAGLAGVSASGGQSQGLKKGDGAGQG